MKDETQILEEIGLAVEGAGSRQSRLGRVAGIVRRAGGYRWVGIYDVADEEIVVPFPTALVSEHLLSPDARTAAAIYAATYFAIAIAFNVLWRYASDGMRLIDPRADSEQVRAITRNYRFGPVFYFAAF